MSKKRDEVMARLSRAGFTTDEARALLRAERVLHTWAEHECNGVIQRDEKTGVPYLYNVNARYLDPHDRRAYSRTGDREEGALKRVQDIANAHGMLFYRQSDPRGCQVYLVSPADVPEGADIGSYYTRGLACCE